jgi:tripartite-type tricarboxylate transporter receptor subunit TctC
MTRRVQTLIIIALESALLLAMAGAAGAQTVGDFYRDRTVALTIGLPAGGGYDTYARLLARHLGRFIPGNPTVVPMNLPGAGGVRAASALYNVAPRDGSQIAMISMSALMMPMFGDAAAKYETTKFSWLGNMNEDMNACGVWHTSGAKRFEDLLRQEVTFGASGPAATTAQYPLVLKNIFGAKARVIMGYTGSNDVNLAMQRGEVDGSCGLIVSSLLTQYRSEWESGQIRLLLQLSDHGHSALGKVPTVFDYATTNEQRDILHFIFDQTILGRPLVAPPEIPGDRRDALRKAISDTMADPLFLLEARKAQMEITPTDTRVIEQLLARFSGYPQSIIEKAKKAQGL